MKEFELTIEYLKKGSDEIYEKEIYVDLDDYIESYSEDSFHLQQQYSIKKVEKEIKPTKKNFLLNLINTQLSNNEELHSNIDLLISEINECINELGEEFESYSNDYD
ncbi:hypothetical protein [Haloimpatiens massiliensis]|uniref:hypothetical protein n=1 Tax=Haloimpatiens massiliensis TaxID=1658110 RepID=UPI000C839875|nr:hypothetical protein [Haloimpatiens massiliensis]